MSVLKRGEPVRIGGGPDKPPRKSLTDAQLENFNPHIILPPKPSFDPKNPMASLGLDAPHIRAALEIEQRLLAEGRKPPPAGRVDSDYKDEDDDGSYAEEDEEEEEVIYDKTWYEVYREEFKQMNFAAYDNMPKKFRVVLNKNVAIKLIEMNDKLTRGNADDFWQQITDFLEDVENDPNRGAEEPSKPYEGAIDEPGPVVQMNEAGETSIWKKLDGDKYSNTKLPKDLGQFLWQAFANVEKEALEAITDATALSDWKNMTKRKLRDSDEYYERILTEARVLVDGARKLVPAQKNEVIKWFDDNTMNDKTGFTELRSRVTHGWDQSRFYKNVGKLFSNVRVVMDEETRKKLLEKESKKKAASIDSRSGGVQGLDENEIP